MNYPDYPRRDRGEQRPDPSDQCIECGDYGAIRCGCCGYPLCGMHHELGGGFCSASHTVGGVTVCVYDDEVYVGVQPREASVLVASADADHYHLPDDPDTTAPACRPREDDKTAVTLELARENDLELCSHCATEARNRKEAFDDRIEREFTEDTA